jgi:uncharacterized membrane protein YgaE (UPF0421/DUF939 family)
MPQPKKYDSHAQRQAAYHRRREEARQKQLQEKGLPALPVISNIAGTTRWRQAIANAASLLELVDQEMEVYFDERSDAWQESERAELFQERIESIRDIRSMIDELLVL